MPRVATQEVLALDVPHPPQPMSALSVLSSWEQKLANEQFDVRILPVIPPASESYPERVSENFAKSREILSTAGGLVVASTDTMILELDHSVITHMEQAAELGIPVFLQAPFEEIAPKGTSKPDAEIVYMGGWTGAIKKRLELGG